MSNTRTPDELARRWRERASELNWEAAYHLRFAADELDSMELTVETNAHYGDRYTDDVPATKYRFVGPWRDIASVNAT